jgi:hypothetical protein
MMNDATKDPGFVRGRGATRSKRVRKAKPPGADHLGIIAFYDACPDGYTVDHWWPIGRGGKHDLPNLQYLTKAQNNNKGCKLPTDTLPKFNADTWIMQMLIRAKNHQKHW